MRRTVILGIALGLAVTGLAEAGIMTDVYIMPVVVRSSGLAGSDWRTELCLNNPNDQQITVYMALIQNGDMEHLLAADIAPYEMICSDDFISSWFELSSWTGGLYMMTDPEDYQGNTTMIFGASVRVYNQQPDGTFGLNVEPEFDPYILAGTGLEMTPTGVASGVRNNGTPGVSGFRTSFGVFNVMDYDQWVDVRAYGEDGVVVWQRSLRVPALSQKQWALPSNVVIPNGGMDGFNNGDGLMFGYITVTDNRTGDGLYRPFQIIYDFDSVFVKSRQANPFEALRDRVRERRQSGALTRR